MSHKKHIDRLFQEKFKDFEAKPNPNVWKGIQSQLDKKKKKRKTIVPIWFKYTGIASVLLLFVAIGASLFNEDKMTSESSPVVNTEKEISTQNISTPTDNKNIYEASKTENNAAIFTTQNQQLKSKSERVAETPSTKTKSYIPAGKTPNFINTKKKTVDKAHINNKQRGYASTKPSNKEQKKTTLAVNDNQSKNPSDKNSDFKNNAIKESNKSNMVVAEQLTNKTDLEMNSAQNVINEMKKASSKTDLVQTEKNPSTQIDTTKTSESIEEAIANNEKILEEEKEENKWTVNANIAPVYYNSLGKGSPIHEQFTENKKNGELNTSFGVMVGYALNDRIKVRSGLNKLNLSYDTANVIVYETASNNQGPKGLRNINFATNSNGQTISVLSSDNLIVQQINTETNVVNNVNAALSQRMSYFEIPLELEYVLVKKRFGINLIGGISTFILNSNEVVSEFEERKTLIGTANNINNLSFSTNLGIGLDYKFSETFKLNIEPSFKYQINTFSEVSGNFKPYIIGVYTGFSYKF